MTCIYKNVCNHINVGCSIIQVIAESINNPLELSIETSGEIAVKVMVSNIEIGSDKSKFLFERRMQIFDLSDHKGECSVTVIISNLTSNKITVNSFLENEGQSKIIPQPIYRYEAPLGKFDCPNDCESFLLSPGSIIQCPSCDTTHDIESLGYDV